MLVLALVFACNPRGGADPKPSLPSISKRRSAEGEAERKGKKRWGKFSREQRSGEDSRAEMILTSEDQPKELAGHYLYSILIFSQRNRGIEPTISFNPLSSTRAPFSVYLRTWARATVLGSLPVQSWKCFLFVCPPPFGSPNADQGLRRREYHPLPAVRHRPQARGLRGPLPAA